MPVAGALFGSSCGGLGMMSGLRCDVLSNQCSRSERILPGLLTSSPRVAARRWLGECERGGALSGCVATPTTTADGRFRYASAMLSSQSQRHQLFHETPILLGLAPEFSVFRLKAFNASTPILHAAFSKKLITPVEAP